MLLKINSVRENKIDSAFRQVYASKYKLLPERTTMKDTANLMMRFSMSNRGCIHPWGQEKRSCYLHLYCNATNRAREVDKFTEESTQY